MNTTPQISRGDSVRLRGGPRKWRVLEVLASGELRIAHGSNFETITKRVLLRDVTPWGV